MGVLSKAEAEELGKAVNELADAVAASARASLIWDQLQNVLPMQHWRPGGDSVVDRVHADREAARDRVHKAWLAYSDIVRHHTDLPAT